MRVSRINQFFRKAGATQIRYRWPILAILFVITVICSFGLVHFALSRGEEGWFGDSDEITINTKKYEQVFGNLNSIGVLLVKQDDGDVFSEEILNVIDKIGTRLQDEIPFANRLTSIINVNIPVGNEEGFEIVKPFENGIPSDSAELAKARALVMRGNEKRRRTRNLDFLVAPPVRRQGT